MLDGPNRRSEWSNREMGRMRWQASQDLGLAQRSVIPDQNIAKDALTHGIHAAVAYLLYLIIRKVVGLTMQLVCNQKL